MGECFSAVSHFKGKAMEILAKHAKDPLRYLCLKIIITFHFLTSPGLLYFTLDSSSLAVSCIGMKDPQSEMHATLNDGLRKMM